MVRHHKINATAVVRRNDGCRFQARRKAESKIIVNVKKLTGRLREAKGELPQEISSRGGWYTTCKFNIFKNDKCQKNELRFKRGSEVESIRGAGHNKNPKPNFFLFTISPFSPKSRPKLAAIGRRAVGCIKTQAELFLIGS